MKRQLGFTLGEVLIALGIMSLLFVGGLTLFVLSIQLSLKTHAIVTSTADASLAAQRVTDDTRHALWVALPSDTATNFTAPTGTSTISFQTTSQGSTIDTAVEIVFPAYTTASMATGVTSSSTITIANRASATNGGAMWVYRSDTTGQPNSAGTCVWIKGTEQGIAVNQAILKSLDPTESDAVQFRRPTNAVAPISVQPYLLGIKIISAYYSAVGGMQKSDSTLSSQTSALSPRTVQMRDHETNIDHQGYSGTVTTTPSSPWLSN